MVGQNAKMILSVCDYLIRSVVIPGYVDLNIIRLAYFLDFQITYDGVTYDGALGIYLNVKKRICLIRNL